MATDKAFLVQFSFMELRIIKGSFNEVCNGFLLPDFKKKIGMTRDSAWEYMENLWPIYLFMRNLANNGGKALPKTQKQLGDGNVAYWDEQSQSVVFETPDKRRIVYQPENGKKYFTKLSALDVPVEAEYKLSLLMRLGVPDLKLMLAVVAETLRVLHEEYEEYQTRMGPEPEDAERTMEKLRTEITKHFHG